MIDGTKYRDDVSVTPVWSSTYAERIAMYRQIRPSGSIV